MIPIARREWLATSRGHSSDDESVMKHSIGGLRFLGSLYQGLTHQVVFVDRELERAAV